MSIWHKNLFAAAAVAGVVLFDSHAGASLPSLSAAVPEDGKIKFDVYRKGDRIGTHKLTFTEYGDNLQVDVEVKFKVKFLFVTVYRYKHQATEVWSDGRLVSLASETIQNGKEWSLQAVCNESETVVEVNSEQKVFEGSFLPTSYWNAQIVEQSTLLNTQFGSAIDVNITAQGSDRIAAMGQEIDTVRYNISAFVEETGQPVDADVWYDERGELMKLQFVAKDGSVVEYRRVS